MNIYVYMLFKLWIQAQFKVFSFFKQTGFKENRFKKMKQNKYILLSNSLQIIDMAFQKGQT